MLYKAVPPLYMIKNGNKKKFFSENSDMIEYTMKEFQKNYEVTDLKGNKISNRQLKEIFIKNADYTYEINTSADNRALSPQLMEFLLYENIKGRKGRQMKSDIEKLYRFVDFKTIKGIEVIKISDDKLYTVYNTPDIFLDCKHVIDHIKNNEFMEYKLNKKTVTLYQLMSTFESLNPKNLHRFKGLGVA